MHIMIDLETLSLEPNAHILSIGAAAFDPNAALNGDAQPDVIDTFYTVIDPATVDRRFHIDPGTVHWWMQPDMDAARRQLTDVDGIDIGSALDGFAMWCAGITPHDDNLRVWGNAASFDLTVLSTAYKLLGLERPWGFRDERCYRTLKNIRPDVTVESVGVAHSAVDDAVYQALRTQAIVADLKEPIT